MNIIEYKIYTRNEILEILETNRLDSAKNKLNSMNIKYNIIGRGDNCKIEIKFIPDDYELKKYCKDILGFNSNTVNNYMHKLKPVLYSLIYFGDDFINITDKFKKEYIEEVFNINIMSNTISKYIKIINKGNLITKFNETSIKFGNSNGHIVYISSEKYKSVWREYMQTITEKYPCYNLLNLIDDEDFIREIKNKFIENTPEGYKLRNEFNNIRFKKKHELKLFNGIYCSEIFKKLRELIKEDDYNNVISVKQWLINHEYLLYPNSKIQSDFIRFYD